MITSGENKEAEEVSTKKEKVLSLNLDLRKKHMNRVGKGKCDAKLTAPFNKLIHVVERMSDSCADIADAAGGKVDFNYFSDYAEE